VKELSSGGVSAFHVSHFTSHISHLTSHILHLTSHILHLTSYVSHTCGMFDKIFFIMQVVIIL